MRCYLYLSVDVMVSRGSGSFYTSFHCFHVLPWKLNHFHGSSVEASVEVVEASEEVTEVSMEVMDGPVAVVEAPISFQLTNQECRRQRLTDGLIQ